MTKARKAALVAALAGGVVLGGAGAASAVTAALPAESVLGPLSDLGLDPGSGLLPTSGLPLLGGGGGGGG